MSGGSIDNKTMRKMELEQAKAKAEYQRKSDFDMGINPDDYRPSYEPPPVKAAAPAAPEDEEAKRKRLEAEGIERRAKGRAATQLTGGAGVRNAASTASRQLMGA